MLAKPYSQSDGTVYLFLVPDKATFIQTIVEESKCIGYKWGICGLNVYQGNTKSKLDVESKDFREKAKQFLGKKVVYFPIQETTLKEPDLVAAFWFARRKIVLELDSKVFYPFNEKDLELILHEASDYLIKTRIKQND